MDPWAAYLLLRGMKTLDLRVKRQAETAMKLATYLKTVEGVEQVFYPGLEDHQIMPLRKNKCQDLVVC